MCCFSSFNLQYVYPRVNTPELYYLSSMKDLGNKTADICNSNSKCSRSPFSSLKMYDYIMNIIYKSQYRHDYQVHLNGISMKHASMLPFDMLTKLITDLRVLVGKIENNTMAFPIIYKISKHNIEINSQDLNYLYYLIKLYDDVQCLYSELLNISAIPVDLRRFAYHVTSPNQRPGKLFKALIYRNRSRNRSPCPESFFFILEYSLTAPVFHCKSIFYTVPASNFFLTELNFRKGSFRKKFFTKSMRVLYLAK